MFLGSASWKQGAFSVHLGEIQFVTMGCNCKKNNEETQTEARAIADNWKYQPQKEEYPYDTSPSGCQNYHGIVTSSNVALLLPLALESSARFL